MDDPSPPLDPSPAETITLTITHHGRPQPITLPSTSTLPDLSTHIHTQLSIPPSHQKFLITPKTGLLHHPLPPLPLNTLFSKKILLLAPTPSDLTTLAAPKPSRPLSRPTTPAIPSRRNSPASAQKAQDLATYTFHTLLPLSTLPDPARSLAYLARLRSDPGIQATMLRHRFRVGCLTEMDPAQHTTHASRTLGLNRNGGEVIELRLRTDAGDGYRAYGDVRKTLCHELAHNVFAEHDARFWKLCGEIENEVRRGDWRSGGRALTGEVFYEPESESAAREEVDGGGWTGGEFVLGGRGEGGRGVGRREAMAKAAEERIGRQKEAERGGGGPPA